MSNVQIKRARNLQEGDLIDLQDPSIHSLSSMTSPGPNSSMAK